MKPTIVDLRSDTVTQPTPKMRSAMAEATVGDDVYNEDPTVNQLQQDAAELFEREAALFVPSGTMANQIAIRIYVQAGQEVICEEPAHIFNFELGMASAFTGCLIRPLYADDGILFWDLISSRLQTTASKYGGTALIEVENTSNLAGGTVYPPDVTKEICEQAHKLNIPVFLDGARIFNAAIALDISVAEASRNFDSLMFSLSKGLGAPVGSMLVGDGNFIEEARHVRKMLGGGMRQAGILGAAGVVALKEGPSRLRLDHENAQFLASELASCPGLLVHPKKVTTNIVLVNCTAIGLNASQLAARLAAQGVLVHPIARDTIRLVTHRDVSRTQCECAARVIGEVVRPCGRNATPKLGSVNPAL